jgi:hypothetical protein
MSRFFERTPANEIVGDCLDKAKGCRGKARGWPTSESPAGLTGKLTCDVCGAVDYCTVPHPEYPEFSRATQQRILKDISQ